MDITPEEPRCMNYECGKSSMCVDDHLLFQYRITSGKAAHTIGGEVDWNIYNGYKI
jgi:hypothetical protein